MEEILVCVAMTVTIFASELLAYRNTMVISSRSAWISGVAVNQSPG